MESLLDGLLPKEIRTAVAPIDDHTAALRPQERSFIARAVQSRQHEFSTGRLLARRLMASLGEADVLLLADEKRVPTWPTGIVGSISHSGPWCVAGVARASEFLGVGIDIEPDEPVKPGIEHRVCRADELAWVAAGVDAAERGRRCRVVFSIKEAVYKAFFPHIREYWGFADVGVSIDLEAGQYEAVLPESAGIATLAGRVLRRDGWIAAGASVHRAEASAPDGSRSPA